MRNMIVVAALVSLVSCSRDIQNTEAVKQGVVNYLKSRSSSIGLNVDSMKIDVTSVSFASNVAHATVSFTPKGMQGAAMTMSATLDRKGNQWVVRGHLESGSATPHGAGGFPAGSGAPEGGSGASPGALPPGHPGIGSGDSPSNGTLPPGHPAIGSGSPSSGGSQLPPGHPPVGQKQ